MPFAGVFDFLVFFLTYVQKPYLAAMKPIRLLFFAFLVHFSGTASGQTTFKVVCDRTDNLVKIVPAEDRSPELVPIRGGFPFFQIARQYADEHSPDVTCKPEELLSQDGAVPGKDREYKQYSLLLAGMVSNLGDPFYLDPPVFLGGGVGVEILLGRALYFGTGLQLNLLGALIPDDSYPYEDSSQWLYFLKTPVFAGIRTPPAQFSLKLEFGLAYNFEPHGVTPDWQMDGLVPARGSLSGIARVKGGLDVLEFEFGFENGMTDLFTNEEGFRHRIIYLGTRINF